ncbi:MAG TPA: hypothetical protein VK644_02670, partial [Chitinophagaceae bacterium]|nr:hypothetical protein [Chitinophagaceae bacterium]
LLILYLFMISASPSAIFPEATISNRTITARLYLPDTAQGYYRAGRFDWAGVISELRANGHSYYGQWFDKYDPLRHDAIMGPVEAFEPLGYERARPGETFVKIGIGVLVKPVESNYFFANHYKILDPGTWTIKKARDRIEFKHVLSGNNISYSYEKTVALAKKGSELQLIHTLRNTGKDIIETDVFNHNFFMLDNELTGPGAVIKFPFTLSTRTKPVNDLATINGKQIGFSRELKKGESVLLSYVQGFDSTRAQDYDIRVENLHSGAGVRITSDRPMSRLAFWAIPATLCPEPYIHVRVEPGKEFSWTITYEYYDLGVVTK